LIFTKAESERIGAMIKRFKKKNRRYGRRITGREE
jgi:hypothetical protein